MADKSLISKLDGVLVKVGSRLHRVDKGAAVPDGADADHVEVLARRGLVVEGTPDAGFAADPDAAPPFQAPKPAKKS